MLHAAGQRIELISALNVIKSSAVAVNPLALAKAAQKEKQVVAGLIGNLSNNRNIFKIIQKGESKIA